MNYLAVKSKMETVKRNTQGEITHIRVGADMMLKEDAHKVMYGSVTAKDMIDFLKKEGMKEVDITLLLMDILNEKEQILEVKKKIMGFK